jgi:hypothetical protein
MIGKLIGPRILHLRHIFGAQLAFPPGHFYSPVCDRDELEVRYRDPDQCPVPTTIPGIDLAHGSQVELWESWASFLAEARINICDGPSSRYGKASRTFGVGDAVIYQCMLRTLRPNRLIEIGCGSSSALAMDTIDQYLSDRRPRCLFVDPHPEYARSLLRPADLARVEIIAAPVQDIELGRFDELGRDDILFIDSTHVVKTGSDVVFELFEILPRLKPGVVVHFHDVFYPFEYPREWVMERNYSWNELYAIRAYLTDNSSWRIMFFNNYFAQTETNRVRVTAPEILQNPGGGLWLQRR